MTDKATPFAGLSPDLVLDCVDRIGLPTDGRLLALNSYEIRVFQVGIDDDLPVIVKFYRPGRWSDAAILEEHCFTQELADREIPAAGESGPRVRNGASPGQRWSRPTPRAPMRGARNEIRRQGPR